MRDGARHTTSLCASAVLGTLTLVVLGCPTTSAKRVTNLSLRAGSQLRYLSPGCWKLFSCSSTLLVQPLIFCKGKYMDSRLSCTITSILNTFGMEQVGSLHLFLSSSQLRPNGLRGDTLGMMARSLLITPRPTGWLFSGYRCACLTGSNLEGK